MANYSTLKAAIQQVIKENGNNEITGNLLQQSLLSMINSLGSGYQFVGGATPATNPGTPDNNVFYLATENGTYTNFGGIVVENEIAFLAWNGTWVKTSIPKGGGNTIITNSDISTTPYLDILLDEDLALRIDIMGPYTGGTTETRCGSIIVSIKYYNDECFSDAYYYGHNLADLLTNIAIVSYGGAKYLRMVASMDLDLIAFSISPIDTNFSSAALSSESATTIQTIVPQILLLPSDLKTINDQSLIGSGNINIVSPKIVTYNGSYSGFGITIRRNRAFRIDIIESNEQDDYIRRIGSLIVNCEIPGGNIAECSAMAYYYGYDNNWMLSELAIYQFDPTIYPDDPAYFLFLKPNSDGFPATLSITPLDGLDVDVFEHNDGDEDEKQADATIELVGKDGKMGIISQTQTWSGSGSNPRTYVMSNPVWGIIPQSNIDLFEAAGAVFNAATGYFELNGLADISYNEMKIIYNAYIQADSRRWSRLYAYSKARTNLPFEWYGRVDSNILDSNLFTNGLVQSFLEVFTMPPQTSARPSFSLSSVSSMLYAAYYLREIKNPFIISGVTALNTFNAPSLENLQLYGLNSSEQFNYCSKLSLSSIVYIVENAANTSQITITLHSTAFARCQADTTEYTYQGNTYVGIINLATAHNIVIQSA